MRLTYLFYFIGVITIFTGCNAPSTDVATIPIPIQTQTAPTIEFPAYVDSVWPQPGAEITLTEYENSINSSAPLARGVGIGISGHAADVPLNVDIEYVTTHSQLWIDGQAIDHASLVVGDGLQYAEATDIETGVHLGTQFIGPAYMRWAPPLTIGIHTANYVFTGGDVPLEYEWQFTIR